MDKVIWVCKSCGSREVEILQWIDANTGKMTTEYEADSDEDTWCRTCEKHAGIVDLSEYQTVKEE